MEAKEKIGGRVNPAGRGSRSPTPVLPHYHGRPFFDVVFVVFYLFSCLNKLSILHLLLLLIYIHIHQGTYHTLVISSCVAVCKKGYRKKRIVTPISILTFFGRLIVLIVCSKLLAGVLLE